MLNSAKLRALLSSLLLLTFIVVSFTGVGLWLSPSGRIARETGWNFFGIDKWRLERIHTIFGLGMTALVVLHFILNYRMYINELKTLKK